MGQALFHLLACRLGGETPEGGVAWLGTVAAIGLWIARRRTRDAAA